MKFTIEFYETSTGRCPVRDFLDELKAFKMKGKINFDRYLQDQLSAPDFAARFKKAGEAWDLAIQLAGLRKEAGLSQKELAKRVGTSQQQISRLESPSYEGHSLSMIRRVAEALGATVRVEIERGKRPNTHAIAESKAKYRPDADQKMNS